MKHSVLCFRTAFPFSFSSSCWPCAYSLSNQGHSWQMQEEARRQINPRDGWIPEEPAGEKKSKSWLNWG